MSPDRRSRRRRLQVAGLIAMLAGVGLWWALSRPSNDVCDGEIGPAALVAVDAATGEKLWTRLVGRAQSNKAHADGPVLVLDALTHELRVDLGTGELISCVATSRPEQDRPALPVGETAPAIVEEADGYRLEVRGTGAASRQERLVTILGSTAADPLWSAVIPGFEVHLVGGLLISIDQTGGTGAMNPLGPDTRVTAYALDSGDSLWQVAVPGTPYEAIAVGDFVVVPGTTSLFGIDAGSGVVEWEVDHGSPGQGGRYSYAGGYSRLFADPDGEIVVGLIRAGEPRED